jgi:hypothetical protein
VTSTNVRECDLFFFSVTNRGQVLAPCVRFVHPRRRVPLLNGRHWLGFVGFDRFAGAFT